VLAQSSSNLAVSQRWWEERRKFLYYLFQPVTYGKLRHNLLPDLCSQRPSIYLPAELSPSWEAANCRASQEFSSILRSPKVPHRVHKSPALVPILSQIDPVHTFKFYLSKIYTIYIYTVSLSISLRSILSISILSSHLPLCLPHSFWLSHQYPICIPPLPHSCYMPCSSHPPWLYHSNYVWQAEASCKFS
jgi:hypothetical protein